MNTQTQIDKAIVTVERARKLVRELKLPKFKRVRIGVAFKQCAMTNLYDAKMNLELLNKHLEEQ